MLPARNPRPTRRTSFRHPQASRSGDSPPAAASSTSTAKRPEEPQQRGFISIAPASTRPLPCQHLPKRAGNAADRAPERLSGTRTVV
jgi:hypothetical protein